MALSAGPRFRPVSETRKKGGGEGREGERERKNGGKEVWVSFPGHCWLLEVRKSP